MINILEVVTELQKSLRSNNLHYLAKVKQTNGNLMVTCPYHKGGSEHSPSCGILLEDRASHGKISKAGTVHCFTCGETHSLEEMISFVFGHDDRGAYGKEWLLEHFNILGVEDIDFDFSIEDVEKPLPNIDYKGYKRYHPYFAQRGISEKVADAFDLGYDEFHDAVVFPLFDRQGNCIMLIKRSINEHVYMNTSGASKTDSVYGIHMIYRKLSQMIDVPHVFIVEGAFDVLKLWQAGYPAVGILQASLSEHQISLIEKLPFNGVVVATDSDEAGRRVAYKLAHRLSRSKDVFLLEYPPGVKDAGDMTDEQLRNMRIVPYGE